MSDYDTYQLGGGVVAESGATQTRRDQRDRYQPEATVTPSTPAAYDGGSAAWDAALQQARALKSQGALTRTRPATASVGVVSAGFLERAISWAKSPSPIGLPWGVVVAGAVVAGVVYAKRRHK